MCFRDSFIPDFPIHNVHSARDRRFPLNRSLDSAFSQKLDKSRRDICEGLGRGSRICARHIGHAIMDDAIDEIGGIAVRRGSTRREAAALVDRDVDQH